MNRDHLAASIACIAAQARLAECLVRASRGNEWLEEAHGWLNDIDVRLDKSRMLLHRWTYEADSTGGGEGEG